MSQQHIQLRTVSSSITLDNPNYNYMQVGQLLLVLVPLLQWVLVFLTSWSEVNYVFSRANKIVNGTDDGHVEFSKGLTIAASLLGI